MGDIPHLAGWLAELRKQFSGVLFAARQATLKQLTSMTYDAKTGSLDQQVVTMRLIKDKMERIGLLIPDDIFALLLANLMPSTFPDVLTSFEWTLLKDPASVVTTSDASRALGAEHVGHRRREVSSEVMKFGFVPDNWEEN